MIDIILWFGINNVINPNSFSNNPFVSGANYPYLSSETHRSLSVELAKRGEQGAGSAILFATFHLTIWCNLLFKIINIALCFLPSYFINDSFRRIGVTLSKRNPLLISSL